DDCRPESSHGSQQHDSFHDNLPVVDLMPNVPPQTSACRPERGRRTVPAGEARSEGERVASSSPVGLRVCRTRHFSLLLCSPGTAIQPPREMSFSFLLRRFRGTGAPDLSWY